MTSCTSYEPSRRIVWDDEILRLLVVLAVDVGWCNNTFTTSTSSVYHPSYIATASCQPLTLV